jgi:hypothetical protein
MASLDFSSAQLPRLIPLESSFAENDTEADLKRLLLELFDGLLAASLFDVNVLGAAHLGSFDLVRKAVNTDGLVLLQGDGEEPATRYLYRAWKSRNTQGRGLHFLRTYLQMLFPNIGQVVQLWQGKSAAYPTDLREEESADAYLTSRLCITVNSWPDAGADRLVMDCVTQVVAARFVPKLQHFMTSSTRKIRPVCIAAFSQNFKTAGVLGMTFPINAVTGMNTAGISSTVQLLILKGTAT